ncbi:MAG: galactose mutarotase [Oscillibacter sp.]|nr:galactose mutarotase [Oscillibacter sp.]
MKITKKEWGAMPDGRAIDLYTIENAKGSSVSVTTYGGIITSIRVPDAAGQLGDVVLGYDTAAEYLADNAFLGAMIGRYANRIRAGQFTLGGETFHLTVNNRGNTLHGGGGFHKKLWDAEARADGFHLFLVSPDGEDGFPGTLRTEIVCSLSDGDELTLDMRAVSDKDTVCCLTNHTYFNLAGGGTVASHRFQIRADAYTPFDEAHLPRGTVCTVSNTPYDFRALRPLKEQVLDINFVVTDGAPCAVAENPISGRTLSVYSDLPALGFYTAGSLSPRRGRDGAQYGPCSGFCLEPQFYPDSPNNPQFPSCVLRAGEEYRHFIRYRFSADGGGRTE